MTYYSADLGCSYLKVDFNIHWYYEQMNDSEMEFEFTTEEDQHQLQEAVAQWIQAIAVYELFRFKKPDDQSDYEHYRCDGMLDLAGILHDKTLDYVESHQGVRFFNPHDEEQNETE